jgi:hypothetical protein
VRQQRAQALAHHIHVDIEGCGPFKDKHRARTLRKIAGSSDVCKPIGAMLHRCYTQSPQQHRIERFEWRLASGSGPELGRAFAQGCIVCPTKHVTEGVPNPRRIDHCCRLLRD